MSVLPAVPHFMWRNFGDSVKNDNKNCVAVITVIAAIRQLLDSAPPRICGQLQHTALLRLLSCRFHRRRFQVMI